MAVINWNAYYPQIWDITCTTARFLAECDQDGTAYFVIVPHGDPSPSQSQIEEGKDSTGTPVASGFSGSVPLTANVEAPPPEIDVFRASNLVPQTAYDAYLVARMPLSGPYTARVEIDFVTADVTPPVWISTYPKMGSIGRTAAQFLVKTNISGHAYFVVVPHGAHAPTSEQVKAGEDFTGAHVAAGFFGSVVLAAITEADFVAANLTQSTTYDAYLVAEDVYLSLQAAPTKLTFVTTAVNAPTWASSYPKNGTQGETSATFLVKTLEATTAYFVVVARADAVPTSQQVKDHKNGHGAVVAAGFWGTVGLTADVEGTLAAANLLYNQDYDVWLVAEGSNLQANPVRLFMTTRPKIVTQKVNPIVEIGSIVSIILNNLTVLTAKHYPDDFIIAAYPADTDNQYEIINLNGTSVDVKMIGDPTNGSRFIKIRVGDGIQTSYEFAYGIGITKVKQPKRKPYSYGVSNVTPPNLFIPPFRRQSQ